MQGYLFVPRVLDLVAKGETFRTVISWVLRIASVGLALAALLSWMALWGLTRYFEAQGVIGLVVFQLVFALATYAMVHTILIRARDIRNLPEAEFNVIPIVAVCCRLVGECLAWFFSALAIGGALLMLFAGPGAGLATGQLPLSGFMSSGTGLLGALLYAAGGLLIGFGALLVFYLLAESSALLGAIARHAEVIRRHVERFGGGLPGAGVPTI